MILCHVCGGVGTSGFVHVVRVLVVLVLGIVVCVMVVEKVVLGVVVSTTYTNNV